MLDFRISGEPGVQNGNRTVRFGAFEADLHSGEVRKSGNRVKLQDQPFKVLQILLEHPGDLVTREELQTRIWPNDNFGDFDHAVNVAVGKLRTALGDSAESPSFIETVPRRGYRFVAKLDVPPADPPVEKALPPAPPPVVPPQPSSLSRRKLILAALAAMLLCAALVSLGIWLGRRGGSQPLEFQRLTVRRGTVFAARFAPDGHNVIYGASWDGAPIELFTSDLKIPGMRSMGIAVSQLLAVSSTGELAVLQSANPHFMMSVRGTLGQVPITGGTPRQLAENVEWADWAPDGKTLAIVRDMGGKQRLEYPLGHVLYETSGWIGHPRISPKGGRIAFLDHPTQDDDRGDVALIDFSGKKTVLSRGWESEEGLAWSPDGREVWFSATHAGLQRRIYAVDQTGRERLVFRAPGGVSLQDIAPDGRLLLTRDEQRAGIIGMGPGASRERDLSWLDWSLPVELSRDGNTLLFDEQGEEGGATYTVAMRDMQGTPPVPLGEGMAGDLSPDGKWATTIVAYSQLMLLPTGAGTARQIERANIDQYRHGIHWLPDGKHLVFPANEPGHDVRCWVQSVEAGGPRPLTPEGVGVCPVSADGKWVAGSGSKIGRPLLYPIEGGPTQAIAGLMPGEGFAWTADPGFAYVYPWRPFPLKVYRLNVATGQRQLFREINPTDLTGLCGLTQLLFSADGRSYAYGYSRLLSELYLVNGLR